MSEGDWRGNKDMERERQGDEEKKEDRDTAAEGQSMQAFCLSHCRKGCAMSVWKRKEESRSHKVFLFIEIGLIGSEKGISLI